MLRVQHWGDLVTSQRTKMIQHFCVFNKRIKTSPTPLQSVTSVKCVCGLKRGASDGPGSRGVTPYGLDLLLFSSQRCQGATHHQSVYLACWLSFIWGERRRRRNDTHASQTFKPLRMPLWLIRGGASCGCHGGWHHLSGLKCIGVKRQLVGGSSGNSESIRK